MKKPASKNFFDEIDKVTENRKSEKSNPFESESMDEKNPFGEPEQDSNPFDEPKYSKTFRKSEKNESTGNPFGEIPS